MRHTQFFRREVLAWLGLCASLFCPPAGAAAAASDEAQTALRLSWTLSQLSEDHRLDIDNRNLLRLEARAGQLGVDERLALGDMAARLDRMGRTVAELQPLIAAIPDNQTCAVVPVAPGGLSAITEHGQGFAADPTWLHLAGGVAILSLLVMLWQQRRHEHAESGNEGSFGHTEMGVGPLSATMTLPPATFSPASREAANGVPLTSSASPEAASTEADTGAAATPAVPAEPLTPRPPATADINDAELALELADTMVAMRLNDRAAQTLEDHLREHPREGIIPWLRLLDIYRSAGQQGEFEAAALRLQHHFNAAPAEWQAGDPTSSAPRPDRPGPDSSLENYPHISQRLQELWPHPACADYLSHLLADNRGGTRSGFPPAVVSEILLLLDLLHT